MSPSLSGHESPVSADADGLRIKEGRININKHTNTMEANTRPDQKMNNDLDKTSGRYKCRGSTDKMKSKIAARHT